eukprot:scaffold1.g5491.t1
MLRLAVTTVLLGALAAAQARMLQGDPCPAEYTKLGCSTLNCAAGPVVEGCTAPDANGEFSCSRENSTTLLISYADPCSEGGAHAHVAANVSVACTATFEGNGDVNVTDAGVGTSNVCGSDYGQEYEPRSFTTPYDDAAAKLGARRLMDDVACRDGSPPVAVKDYRLSATTVCTARAGGGALWQRLRPLYRCGDGSTTTAVLWIEYQVDAEQTGDMCVAAVAAAPVQQAA